MKILVASVSAGLLFGLGLGVSGMTQADKVIAFLDVTDAWDPSLALVMVGAIASHAVLYRFILGRRSPMFATRFQVPTRTEIDAPLVGGAALFGVGWALGGYCPGPGIVSLPSAAPNALVFLGGLAVGMNAFEVARRVWRTTPQGSGSDGSTANDLDDGPVQSAG